MNLEENYSRGRLKERETMRGGGWEKVAANERCEEVYFLKRRHDETRLWRRRQNKRCVCQRERMEGGNDEERQGEK